MISARSGDDQLDPQTAMGGEMNGRRIQGLQSQHRTNACYAETGRVLVFWETREKLHKYMRGQVWRHTKNSVVSDN